MGIQERSYQHMMTGPIIYALHQQSVIVRTCTTQLKQETFRRGYVGKNLLKPFVKIVVKSTNPLKNARCGTDLRKPDVKH